MGTAAATGLLENSYFGQASRVLNLSCVHFKNVNFTSVSRHGVVALARPLTCTPLACLASHACLFSEPVLTRSGPFEMDKTQNSEPEKREPLFLRYYGNQFCKQPATCFGFSVLHLCVHLAAASLLIVSSVHTYFGFLVLH